MLGIVTIFKKQLGVTTIRGKVATVKRLGAMTIRGIVTVIKRLGATSP